MSALISACWPGQGHGHKADPLLWEMDLCGRSFLSMAVVQANEVLEDQTQLFTGPHGTFVGIYDGHGGPDASCFLSHHLFPNMERFANEEGSMSQSVLKKAFHMTEKKFAAHVDRSWSVKPQMAMVGSCCLVGAICGNKLYVANLGDSRAVIGTGTSEGKGQLVAKRLCPEHNANNEEVRRELKFQHPDDPYIVLLQRGAWRIKGIIQVSRSIGDVYLKNPEFNELVFDTGSPARLTKAVLSAEPSIDEYILSGKDQFLIFASDGLWEHLSDQQAVDIVQSNSRAGIASKLVRAALCEVAKKRAMRHSDLRKIECGVRRYFHDDISVVVLFLDSSSSDPSFPSPLASPCTSASSRPKGRRGIPIHTGELLNAPRNVFPLIHHMFDNDVGTP